MQCVKGLYTFIDTMTNFTLLVNQFFVIKPRIKSKANHRKNEDKTKRKTRILRIHLDNKTCPGLIFKHRQANLLEVSSGFWRINAMRCKVLGMETRQRYSPLTLTIHAGIADTFGRVYFKQIEQIRQQHYQIQFHGSETKRYQISKIFGLNS